MRDDLPVGSAGTGATLLQRPAHNRSKIKAKVGGEDCKDRFACKCPVLLHFRLPITMIASYGDEQLIGQGCPISDRIARIMGEHPAPNPPA